MFSYPIQMHGGGGGGDFHGPGGNDSQDVIWAETKTETGGVYYYNTKTRATSWERPEGPGIRIMSHEEVSYELKRRVISVC
jgi:hypothetical protein